MTGIDSEARGLGPLDRDAYRRLSTKRDLLAALLITIRVAFHISLLACGTLLFARGHVWASLLILIPHFLTWSFLGWAGIGHELFHRSVFTARQPNVLLFRLFSVLTWSNYGYFEVTHPQHHRTPLGANDLEASPHERLTYMGTLALLTVDVAAIWRRARVLSLNAAGKIPTGRFATLFAPGSREALQLRNGARAVFLGQAMILATSLTLGGPYLAAAICLAPFCLTFPNRTLAALQHFNLSADGIRGRYENSTRTVVLDPVTSFFYANMNYHLEHHQFPAIPHYHLRAVHAAFRCEGAHRHIECGYWRGLALLAREGFFTAGRAPKLPFLLGR
ncbi:fatty acid desaturase [Sphingomonas sp.]|uniref:fatty acid desaturase family protein n=1 Tax=Sphingomonas sp. TaxID=28214 RepID=UPI0028AF1C65|nr:fatty acid desaturase [Sphingomonas sp.]